MRGMQMTGQKKRPFKTFDILREAIFDGKPPIPTIKNIPPQGSPIYIGEQVNADDAEVFMALNVHEYFNHLLNVYSKALGDQDYKYAELMEKNLLALLQAVMHDIKTIGLLSSEKERKLSSHFTSLFERLRADMGLVVEEAFNSCK